MELISTTYINLIQAFANIGIRDIIDILIISVCIFKLLQTIEGTRAMQVFKGVGLVLIAAIVADFFKLSAVSWLLNTILQSGVVLALILFQPELRKILEGVGRSGGFKKNSFVSKEVSNRIIENLSDALLELSKRKIGALIVIKGKDSLTDIINSGTTINADIASPLILNIFEPKTPLHDGAVIIDEDRIAAAGCLLPLSENMSISKELGTRHRAGIGISEISDSITFIVSEETGVISYTSEGKLIRYLDKKIITDVLTSIYGTKDEKNKLAALTFLRRTKKDEFQD
ncbi:MAG: diadenylate cyclase CdaA [Clostridia bacterium]|nr:diadenylate cyclase CdaA [Clostridia bacterium]